MEERLQQQSELRKDCNMNKTKRVNCDYPPAKLTEYGPITLCSVSSDKCPYKKSLKFASFDETPVFRCIREGKIEKIVQETVKT